MSRMKPDELPMYPTPQQASYIIPPTNPNARPSASASPLHSYSHQQQNPSTRSFLRQPYKSQSYLGQSYLGQQQQQNHQSHQQKQPIQSQSRPYQQLSQPRPQQQYQPSYQPQQPQYQQQQILPQLQQFSHGQQILPQLQQFSHGQQIPQNQQLYQPYSQSGAPNNGYSSPSISGNAHLQYQQPQHHSGSHGSFGSHSSLGVPIQKMSGHGQGNPNKMGHSSSPPIQNYSDSHNGYNAHNAHEQTRPAMVKKPPASSSKESLEDPKLSSKRKLEAELRQTFERVDMNRSGRISAHELSCALKNFDNTDFQDSAISVMVKLFAGSEANAGLNFEQFVSLWKYLSGYKKLFLVADSDKSGDISFGEFQRILDQIGYKLNVDVVLHLFLKFANKGSVGTNVSRLKFDSFIELLVYLRRLTEIFKNYDKDMSGVATINYLDFLMELSHLT